MKVSKMIKNLTKDTQKQIALDRMIDRHIGKTISWNDVYSIIRKDKKVTKIKHIDTNMFS